MMGLVTFHLCNHGRKSIVNSKELSGQIPREIKQFDVNGFGKKLDEDDFLEEEAVSQKWEGYRNEYSEGEKRFIVAKCIQAGIEIVFTNHIY